MTGHSMDDLPKPVKIALWVFLKLARIKDKLRPKPKVKL
jgi:hypothetical protein